MQRKEFLSVLLLVSLVSTMMLAGIVRSNLGPSISVYPSIGMTASSDVYVYVKGSGWTAGSPVTLYWDQKTDNHTIAVMAPSTSGTFTLSNLEIERVPIGIHTIIAVQGGSTATCTYTVTATVPPDEALLDSLQQVENNVGNTQSNFTTVISGLGDIENKLDNTTSGLPGIQSNLTKIDSDINAVEGKLDQSGKLGNTSQFEARSSFFFFQAGESFNVLDCNASETAIFTITILPYGSDAPYGSKNPSIDTYWINATFDGYSWYTILQRNFNSIDAVTLTIAARGAGVGMGLIGGPLDDGEINAGIAVQYTSGTKLTWDP